ncbi:MAG: hypothetical protein Q9166_004384 [cf. Caloplaca sp. 2 TL-2023]
MDSYRPSHKNPIHDMPPHPPLPEMPPLTQWISRPQRLPQAPYPGGDSWRPQQPHSNIPSRNDFTFRNNSSAPQYPQDNDRYGPARNGMRRMNRARPRGHMSNNPSRTSRWATAARPLLSSKRGSSPEPLLAETTAQNQVQRFLPAEDISDSGEEDMDESNSEDELAVNQDSLQGFIAQPEGVFIVSELDQPEETLEPPAKRRATGPVKDSKQEASVPKWSNPDPYTVLPPVDESQRRRRDVVKIIRKARITAEKETATENQVAANDDFISFGFGGDKLSGNKSRSSSPPESGHGHHPGVPGVSSGPRSFSHLNNLHGTYTNGAPGASDIRPSANNFGPPPDFKGEPRAKLERNMTRQDFNPDQAEALGNRKRTHEDEIKGEAIRVPVKGKKPTPNGSLLQEWRPRGNADSTPWLIVDHRATKNSGFRLHKEVCDFYEFVRPQKYEQFIREDLLQRLQTVIGKQLPECSIHCFGSFAAAMYLPNADMDLVIISKTFRTSGLRVACQSSTQMHKFAHYLQQIGMAERGSVEVIPSAKVPLVKFVDQMTGIRVDVSFENETGLIANDTFNDWKRHFPAMPILTTVIKQFLMMRGLNEVVNGGLGGFSVTCLVTSLLQNLPRVQSGEVVPEQHLGEMLLEFLDLYGNQFDLDRTGISMNPPGYYDKQAAMRNNPGKGVYREKLFKLAILDPNNPNNDISGGSRNVGQIFDLFSQAYDEIMKAMKSQNGMNLLDWVIGGDYSNFTVQRQRLQRLYKARWGSPEPAAQARQIIPSQPLNTLADGTIGGGFEENIMSTTLPVNVFSNPLDPNITLQPKEKRPKPNRSKRNQKQMKEAPNTCTSNLQRDEELVGVPLRNARCRAGLLKEKFPSVAGEIPGAISNQERQTLTKRFMAAKLVPQANKKVDGLSARQTMLRKVDKGMGGKPTSKKTKKPNPVQTLGNSNKVPITIG